MKKKKFFLFLLCPLILNAQEYNRRLYSISDGMQAELVHSVLMDPEGRLLIGGQKGISIYNGLEFTPHNAINQHDIVGSNYFFYSKGLQFLISTPLDITKKSSIFDVTKGALGKVHTLPYRVKSNAPFTVFPQLFSYYGKNYWIGLDNQKQLIIDSAGINIPFLSSFGSDVIDFRVEGSSLFFVKKEHLFIFHGNDLRKINLPVKQKYSFAKTRNNLIDKKTIKIFCEQGIYQLDSLAEIIGFTKFKQPFPGTSGQYQCIIGERIICVYDLHNVFVYSINDNKWIDLSSNTITPPRTSIYSVEIDKEDNIWIGTSFGLQKISSLFFNKINLQTGFGEVSTICISNKKIFLGGRNSFGLIDNSTQKIQTRAGILSDYPDRVMDAIEDGKGGFWFVMSRSGIYRMNNEGKITDSLLVKGIEYTSILNSNENKLFVTGNNKLFLLKNKKLSLLHEFTDIQYIRRIVWLPNFGVGVIGSNKFYLLSSDCKIKLQRITCNRLYNAAVINKKIYLCGDALYKLEPGKISKITLPFNLIKGDIYAVCEGNFSNYYAGGEYGIYQFSDDDHYVNSFTPENGFPVDEINRGAFKIKDSSLWVGTHKGLFNLRIYSADRNYKIKPIIVINDNYSHWNKDSTQITITKWGNKVPFNIQWPSYVFESYNQIEYRVNGGEWDTALLTSNFSPITLGKSGRFKIDFRLFNSSRSYSETESFVVNTPFPWYLRWWNLIPLLLLISLLLYVLYRWRISQINKQNERRRTFIENELKSIRTQLNPHFIQNAFNILALNLPDVIDGFECKKYLYQLSIYFRRVLNIVEKDLHTLDAELDFTEEYLKLQMQVSGLIFEYKIIIEDDVDTDSILVPTMLLQPFVENSLKHGFSNLKYKGVITIHVFIENDILIIETTDNGNGLLADSSGELKLGTGFEITKTRLTVLNKSYKAADLISAGKNFSGSGFFVKIKIPINYE